MDRKIPDFDFDFTPIGQAIKEARMDYAVCPMKYVLAEESNYSDRHITFIENEGQFPSTELLFWLALKFNISLDQYLFPKKAIQKSTSRRQIEAQLDKLTDQELSIISATAEAICKAREPEV